jgi:hypothetical protein
VCDTVGRGYREARDGNRYRSRPISGQLGPKPNPVQAQTRSVAMWRRDQTIYIFAGERAMCTKSTEMENVYNEKEYENSVYIQHIR